MTKRNLAAVLALGAGAWYLWTRNRTSTPTGTVTPATLAISTTETPFSNVIAPGFNVSLPFANQFSFDLSAADYQDQLASATARIQSAIRAGGSAGYAGALGLI